MGDRADIGGKAETLHAIDCACSRFEIVAGGVISLHALCDLEDRVLVLQRCPSRGDFGGYGMLRSSPSLDERRVLEVVMGAARYDAGTYTIKLSARTARALRGLLTDECLLEADGMTDDRMWKRSGGWCYRDCWQLSFTAYDPDGAVVSRTGPLAYCSYPGEELGFEKVIELLSDKYDIFSYGY